MYYVLGSLAVLMVFCIFVLAKLAGRRKERRLCEQAAGTIVKRKLLTQGIQKDKWDNQEIVRENIMLCVRFYPGKRQTYVMDFEHGIRIGRVSAENRYSGQDILIRDGMVSLSHCILFPYEGSMYIEDCQSTNGTYIKRFWFWNRIGTEPTAIRNGAMIRVGSVKMRCWSFLAEPFE